MRLVSFALGMVVGASLVSGAAIWLFKDMIVEFDDWTDETLIKPIDLS